MQCTFCRRLLRIHRAAYRVDGGRILAIYCSPGCCTSDGDGDLAAAFESSAFGWAALDEHGNDCAPWEAPPKTLQQRLMAAFEMPAAAAALLALLAEYPLGLLYPATLLAAAQLPATTRGDRIALSSVLVDAFARTSGSVEDRARAAIASLCERAVPRQRLGEFDIEAARGWLEDHSIAIDPDSRAAEITALLYRSDDVDGWLVPSGAFRLREDLRARTYLRCTTASSMALALLLRDVPSSARVTRYGPSRGVRGSMRAAEVRALLEDAAGPRALPSRVIPQVLSRVPAALEHPTLRGRTPSVRGALALLGDVQLAPRDTDPDATRTLAALLAEPYAVSLERRLALVPTVPSTCGPVTAVVGLDQRGELTTAPTHVVQPVAFLVQSTDGAFVIVAVERIGIVNGESCADIVGLSCCEDGAVWAVCDWESHFQVRPIEELRGTRVEPLVDLGGQWYGLAGSDDIIHANGPMPLGPILIDDTGMRRVHLGLPSVVDSALAFACGIDPDAVSVSDRGRTNLRAPMCSWGPVALALEDGACVLGAFDAGAPHRRLLVDDGPIEPGGRWQVLRREDDVVTIAQAAGETLSVREIPVSEATFRFRGSPQVGEELLALH